MNIQIHPANSRGKVDMGWLKSAHTFSFGHYHDPERMGFGLLRVINDDRVAPKMGFDTHPHDNMEIISVAIKGSLKHEDSMGNVHIIQENDIQIMSAGTGIQHSEYNNSATEECNFLQIWVFPKVRNIVPRYAQATFDPEKRKNKLQWLISPDERDSSLKINQDAYFSMIKMESYEFHYHQVDPENGTYFFVIDGNVTIAENLLEARDGIAIQNVNSVGLKTETNAEVLIIEIPLERKRKS